MENYWTIVDSVEEAEQDRAFEEIKKQFQTSSQRFFAIGKYLGFPECCILDFIFDVQHRREPGTMRGSIYFERPGKYNLGFFVPCRNHFENPPNWALTILKPSVN